MLENDYTLSWNEEILTNRFNPFYLQTGYIFLFGTWLHNSRFESNCLLYLMKDRLNLVGWRMLFSTHWTLVFVRFIA